MRKLWITQLDGGGNPYYTDNTDMNPLRIARLIKNGTSLVVVIPKEILTALDMKRGDQVLLQVPNSQSIVVSKLSDKEIMILKRDGIKDIS